MVILVVTKSRSVIEDKYSICSPPLLHHQEKWEKSAVLPKSSFALPWKANVRLENFVYQLNHWAHWLNRFHRLTKICAPTRIIQDHPVPFKSKCHDDKTFTAMIGEPHIMGASLFQFVIIFLFNTSQAGEIFRDLWVILSFIARLSRFQGFLPNQPNETQALTPMLIKIQAAASVVENLLFKLRRFGEATGHQRAKLRRYLFLFNLLFIFFFT